MGNVFFVASAKGGSGKTSLTAVLGRALAARGVETLLIDLCCGNRNLDLALGLEEQVFYHLQDVISGGCDPEDAILRHPEEPLLAYLPAPQTKVLSEIDPKGLAELLLFLRKAYGMILIDTPSGECAALQAILLACADVAADPDEEIVLPDGALIVTSGEKSSLRGADIARQALEADRPLPEEYLVINRMRPEWSQSHVLASPEEIEDLLGMKVKGQIPEDPELLRCLETGDNFLAGGSGGAAAVRDLAGRLLGEAIPFPKPVPPEIPRKKGWFSFLVGRK